MKEDNNSYVWDIFMSCHLKGSKELLDFLFKDDPGVIQDLMRQLGQQRQQQRQLPDQLLVAAPWKKAVQACHHVLTLY